MKIKIIVLVVAIFLLIGGAALVVLNEKTGLEGLRDYKMLLPIAKKQTPVPDIANAGSFAARKDLSLRLGLFEDMIVVVESRHVGWPDGCLGLPQPDEMCTEAIVSGYAVTLRADDREYRYRTSKDGLIVKMEKE